MTDDAARIRDEALDVLRDVLCWELAPARWQQLAEILEAADSAQASGDLDALAKATEQLELAGPVRITRIGSTPEEPPPPPVRERVNRLIRQLSGGTGAGT